MRMLTSIAGKRKNRSNSARQGGFTYAMALVAVVLIGIFAGVANTATFAIVQKDREEELLFRGMAYRSAIQRYHAVAKRYPRSLNDLLMDTRFAHRPYLRSLYPDPMMEKVEGAVKPDNGGWLLIRSADGGIAGVASGSRQEPMKKAHFPPGLEKFENTKSYSEWSFEYSPELKKKN